MLRSRTLFLTALLAWLLAGCQASDPAADIKAEMENIRKQQRGRIDSPPEFREYVTYSYSASLLRSPFQEPIEIVDVINTDIFDRNQNEAVQPDITRKKETLEFFGLDSLVMVGTIKKEDNTLYALISDGKGGIHRIMAGNHMGRNYGEVTTVRQGQIEIMEIVSDGQSGWVKRPRTLVLKENS